MFNNDFDPLRELEILSHNQRILIDRSKEQSALIENMAAHLTQINNTLQKLIREHAKTSTKAAILETQYLTLANKIDTPK